MKRMNDMDGECKKQVKEITYQIEKLNLDLIDTQLNLTNESGKCKDQENQMNLQIIGEAIRAINDGVTILNKNINWK